MADLKAKAEELRKAREEEFANAPPSRIIEMALEDLEAVERTPGYVIDMDVWHDPTSDGRCAVCFAGAVIAHRIGTPKDVLFECMDCSDALQDRFFALNAFRSGNIRYGLELMRIEDAPATVPQRMQVVEYEDNPTQFKSDMRALAETLRSAGL